MSRAFEQVAERPEASSGMLARAGGDRKLLGELIDLFLEDCPPLVERMRQGLADGDCAAVRRAAHSLAGAAMNFDATAVVALAQRLEAGVRVEDLPASLDVFATLEDEVARLLTYLTATTETLRCAS